jgi:hypothetical protein
MNVRYIGDREDGVDLAEPQVHMARLEWVDLPADIARSLNEQDDFELEAPKKAAKTRAEGEE